jgi:hypothetical protein
MIPLMPQGVEHVLAPQAGQLLISLGEPDASVQQANTKPEDPQEAQIGTADRVGGLNHATGSQPS